jgi:hypothetical protein
MRFVQRFTTCNGLALLAGVSASALAQAGPSAAPRTIVLPRANASTTAQFSVIASVRELQDGRVLVTDRRDNLVYVVDFTGKAKAQQLGRRGRGPGEYEEVGRLWRLGGDSTLMLEPMARRGLIFNGSQVVQTVTSTSSLLASVAKPFSMFLGRDSKGAVLSQVMAIGKNGPNPADSMLLVRTSANGAKADTQARVSSVLGSSAAQGPQVSSRGGASPSARYVVSLQTRDQAALFPDGALAVVRANPYRVDWCLAADGCQQGAVIEPSSTGISDQAKEAVIAWWSQTRPAFSGRRPSETTGWPAVLPAFVVGGGFDDTAVLPEPRGNVLVERLPRAMPAASTYDLIDRGGRRIGVVRLEVNQRIVGFGPRSVYTIEVDTDGVQSLQRHEWKY